MSNNLSESKKLQLKSELLRHMETAKRLQDEGKPSSEVKLYFLKEDMRTLENHNIEPNMAGWRDWLEHADKQPAIH